MLHHLSIGVSNIERSAAFYDAILEPLGYIRVFEDLRPGERNQAVGYGTEPGKDKLAIKERDTAQLAAGKGFHLALRAPTREAVEAFHRIGTEKGATDRGVPQYWSDFGPGYFAAYIADPDGWQLEAVWNDPERSGS